MKWSNISAIIAAHTTSPTIKEKLHSPFAMDSTTTAAFMSKITVPTISHSNRTSAKIRPLSHLSEKLVQTISTEL
jgi:hypothetical protein